MATGKKRKHSLIVAAIAEAENGTTGEIRVHLTRRWIEPDAYRRALKLFHRFGMARTAHRNAVLLYINLRRRKLAVVGDEGIHAAVGQGYWEGLVRELRADLHSTHNDNAIAQAVLRLGEALKKHFPAEAAAGGRHNELPDEVSED